MSMNGFMMHTDRQRHMAASICVTIMLVLILSTAYIVVEYKHDCVGDSCPICFQMHQCAAGITKAGMGDCNDFSHGIVACVVIYCCMLSVILVLTESLIDWNTRLDE